MADREHWRRLANFPDAWLNERVMRKEAADQGQEITQADVEWMVEVAQERAALFMRLRDALNAGDTLLALELAREATGLAPETQQ